jgi:hypothetical protein
VTNPERRTIFSNSLRAATTALAIPSMFALIMVLTPSAPQAQVSYTTLHSSHPSCR